MGYLIPDSNCTAFLSAELHNLDSCGIWVKKLHFIRVAFNVYDSSNDAGNRYNTATKSELLVHLAFLESFICLI